MSVWGGKAFWGSSVWDDGTAKFSRDFSIAGSTATVSFPTKVLIKLTASASALAGSISLLTKIAFQAARQSSTVRFISGLGVHITAVMASFAGSLGRSIHTSFSAAMSALAGSRSVLVMKGLAATASTVTVTFSRSLLVALVRFAATAASLSGTLGRKIFVSFAAAASSLKAFAYGLIRKIRVHGGR